jgi:DNA mismatch repair protein mutS
VFGERAKLLSETLGLMLTIRDCGLNERVPMVGFPYHAADNYISKAEMHGLKIVISETLRDLLGDHDGEQMSPQSLPAPSPTELTKHWVDDKTYIDEDGVVHSVDNGSDRKPACDMNAYDAEALAVLKDIFGDLLVLR